MKRIFSLIAVAPFFVPGVFAASPMQFSMALPGFVYAAGDITNETPAAFERFVKAHGGLKGSTVMLNSQGGNVIAAMLLGTAIREAGMNTYVGGQYGQDRRLIGLSECDSSCIWTFAGGVRRTFDPNGGTLGVHQFYGVDDSAVAQYTMTLIGKYLDDMGVKRGLLDLAALTPSSTVHALPRAQAQQFNLDNASELERRNSAPAANADHYASYAENRSTAEITGAQPTTTRDWSRYTGPSESAVVPSQPAGLVIGKRTPFGFDVTELEYAGNKYLVVTAIVPGSSAERAGLWRGDYLCSIWVDGRQYMTKTWNDVADVWRQGGERARYLAFRVQRFGKDLALSL